MTSCRHDETETNYRAGEDSRSYFTELLRFEETMDNVASKSVTPIKSNQEQEEGENIDMKFEYQGLIS